MHLKWIEIDLGAVAHNARWVRSRLEPGVRLMAMVKADAYGHGAVQVGRTALKAGASSLGVLTPAEAEPLRRAGIKAPVLSTAPLLPAQAKDALRLGLTATVDGLDQARALDAEAGARGAGVHIDIDFGLGRWGVPAKGLGAFVAGLKRFKRLRLEGLSTHIDYVPGKNAVEAEEKLRAFSRLAEGLKRDYPRLVAHAANSSVLMDFPHWQLDMVRIGNLLYGINPRAKLAELESPWRFWARIIAVREVARGQAIGYGSEYIAPRRMRVGALPVGYADGLTMEPAERLISFGSGFRYWGMIGGAKAPFIGRCGISHLLVDLSAAPKAKQGDPVALPIRRTAASAHLTRVYK